ncbi:hypothetical protein EDEG_00667 [Edhazardia aedis USNM 41457]|uniref:Spindle pole body component n=1 Tax=Edhazardia aedis (strain USNM 41457) TaxID=1003232 RepID=J9DBZ6_EDHAE|nr:hypothetical protein EDEG_00667 [Edhazardia aedis USNM 41457]|eukprot:EJW05256.1 hypothetical protein EDEG_00667 [Edhazardia aedis USNM 41457]
MPLWPPKMAKSIFDIFAKTSENEIPTDEKMRQNLIYFLAGIDTTNIGLITDKNTTKIKINPRYDNREMLNVFEGVGIDIRNIKRFINQMNYLSDTYKNILAEYMLKEVERYHDYILSCYNKSFEEIYVILRPFIDEFHEFSTLIKLIEVLNEIEIFKVVQERRDLVKNLFYARIYESLTNKIYMETYIWMVQGFADKDFYILAKNEDIFEFDECYWVNKFAVAKTTPIFYKHSIKKIYDSGLYCNIIRKITNRSPDINRIPVTFENFLSEKMDRNIILIYDYIKKQFESLIEDKLYNEIDQIYRCFFLNDVSFILDLFDVLDNDIYLPIDNTLHRMNLMNKKQNEFILFKYADARINHYVLKILNIEKFTGQIRKNVLENVTIEFKNKNIADIFLSKKVFFELEIIFRYLFTLLILEYIFIKLPKNRFNTNATMFLVQLRSCMYTYIQGLKIERGIEKVVGNFTKFIKMCLNKFYLTNVQVFQLFSDILDLFFEYIYVQSNEEIYHERFLRLVVNLKKEIEKISTDHCFLYFLEYFKL